MKLLLDGKEVRLPFAIDKLNLVGSGVTLTPQVVPNDERLEILLTATGGSGGVSDGDKGDVVVSGSGATWTIDANVVTFGKMQAVSADVLLGNDGTGSAVEEIPCTAAGRALLDDASAADQRTTLGLGTLATQSGTFSGTSSGTNTGDQTITLTGDVTGSGTGSFAATIASGAVTFSKMANLSAGRLIGRNSSGAGVPEEIRPTGGVTIDAGGNLQREALVGDVTASLGLNTTTIANDVVTYAKMQNVSAASRLLGRGSASGSGDPEEMTVSGSVSISGTDVAGLWGPTFFKILTADATGAGASTSAQPWFPTNSGVTLTANRSYLFRGIIYTSHTTALVMRMPVAGTATYTWRCWSIGHAVAIDNNTTIQTSAWRSGKGNFNVTASGTAHSVEVSGVIWCTAGGTFIPQHSYDAGGGTVTIGAGTCLALWDIGADTVTERGTWS